MADGEMLASGQAKSANGKRKREADVGSDASEEEDVYGSGQEDEAEEEAEDEGEEDSD
jgi:hypothetical protein